MYATTPESFNYQFYKNKLSLLLFQKYFLVIIDQSYCLLTLKTSYYFIHVLLKHSIGSYAEMETIFFCNLKHVIRRFEREMLCHGGVIFEG